MAVKQQEITNRYAAYNGDCCEVVPGIKDESVHISIYSPPFAELYNYSSSDRDMSNCKNFAEFMEHYAFIVKQIFRVTKPGRISCVHCMDLKGDNPNTWRDFPGDIIRLHERMGFYYHSKHTVWKEPLKVAIRTRALGLMHRQLVKDSTQCKAAGADYILVFRKPGQNKEPVSHGVGLMTYAGENQPAHELFAKYHAWEDPKTNKLSHYIWQRYASSVWMDIRGGRVLPYKPARETEEEKHVCPLQLDIIERCLTLYSNLGDTLLTPFMGVGSEICGAIQYGRRAIGIELKESYYRQAIRNIHHVVEIPITGEGDLFSATYEKEDSEDKNEME